MGDQGHQASDDIDAAPPAATMLALAQFAAGVAHDLNNQLTGVLGFSAVLTRCLDGRPEAVHLAELRSAAQRAATLARELQAFGHRPTVRPHPVDLGEAVEGLLEGLRHRLAGGPAVIGLPAPAPVLALADPTLLTQGLLDLASQLALVTAPGGTLTMEVAPAAAGRRVRIAAHPATIDASQLLRRWLPFAEQKSGHGSTLALATAWMSLHHAGGRLAAHDHDGALVVDVLFAPPPA